MTKCPQCSGENADTQRFCGDCGTPLAIDLRHKTPIAATDETLSLPSLDFDTGDLFARRYQMVEELGMGGMGRVYRVLDKKLNEEIALKVIRPDMASDRGIIARFSSELKLARQVVHRNVARMFDLNEEHGVPYITMEYVKGENLQRLIRKVGRLSPGQAVPIACQICDGLAEAHRLGIVHRDLKPQNVMIDEEGQAKIMDFGLARLLVQDGRDGLGARSGSPAYVSPERIEGKPADARTDLYSLGVLMYEMLTGRTPFKAESIEELLDMHLHEAPRDPAELNPGVPAELSAIVMKCLEKDPGQRYQSATEVREALGCVAKDAATASGRRRWLLIAGAVLALAAAAIGVRTLLREKPWKVSLAVLPVEGTGASGENQSLFAGLQSEITDRLMGVPGLRVVPRMSVDSYDTKGKSSPEIGKLLGVRYLLSVKVDVRSDRVAAKIYVIDAKKDSFLQLMTYNKEIHDYRVLQEEIAKYTARTLGTAIGEEQLSKFRRRGTDNIEAYTLFLDGMALIERHNDDADIHEAIGKYLRAIEVDPNYALAYWGAGNAYENLYYSAPENSDPAVLEKMYEYFHRASELDPSFAETNLGLGWYYFNKGDNPRACEFFKKALDLEPQKYLVRRDAGAFLRSIGLYEQAIRHLNKAIELSPRDSQPVVQIAQSYLFLGRSEEALKYAKQAVALDPSDQDAGLMLALLLMVTESLDEADSQINALEKIGYPVERLGALRRLTARLRVAGTAGAGGAPFTDDKPSMAPHGTYVYLLLGMKDEAIANVQAAIDQGFWHGMYLCSYPSLVKNPWFKDLRNDPRFRAILKRQKEIYLRELKPLEKL